MDLVYFGSGTFGLPTLASLASGHRIRGIVTQPDRPAGRGGKLTPTPVAAWAAEHLPQCPVLRPAKVNEPQIVREIHAWRADAWVVIAFGQKLSTALLAGAPAANLHGSLLPRWRGAAPVNWAILGGDAESGNSVITLADRMDAGLVLGQSRLAIADAQTAGELHDALAADGPALVARVLAAGMARGEAQDEAAVTLAPKLSREDGWIDFSRPAQECRRRINGLSPWPGVRVRLREESLKLVRGASEPDHGRDVPPGTIMDAGAGLVACGGGTAVRLAEVQAAGGRVLAWREFSNGKRVRDGEALIGGRGC